MRKGAVMNDFWEFMLVVLAIVVVSIPLVSFFLLISLRRQVQALQELVLKLGQRPPAAEPAAVPKPVLVAPVPPVMPPVPAAVKPVTIALPVTPRVIPPPVPRPVVPAVPAVDSAARQLLRRVWNWIIVGEEFRRKDVPMEYAVATNWLMRMGILVLVVAVGIWLKYSFESGLLGPYARVALSLVAGAALVAFGLRQFGRSYQLLGQGLVGGGLAMLYFGVYAAGARFHLVFMPVAFGLMAFITFTAGVLAVRYQSLLVAVLACLGGYATPAVLATGQPDYGVLYIYLLLLGLGMQFMASRRQWPLLIGLSFLGTAGYVAGTLQAFRQQDGWLWPMAGVTAFFVLYSFMMFQYNIRHGVKATLVELAGLFLNAAGFFAAGFFLVKGRFGQPETAWLSLGIAVYYTAHIYIFFQRKLRDEALLSTFLSLAAVFLALMMPLRFSSVWLTLAWSLQALALLWQGLRLGSRALMGWSALLYLLVLCRFGFEDMHRAFAGAAATADGWAYVRQMAGRWVQFAGVIATFWGAARLLRRPPAAAAFRAVDTPRPQAWVFKLALALFISMLFLFLHREAGYVFGTLCLPLQLPMVTAVWVGFACAVLVCRDRLAAPWLGGLLLLAVAALFFKWLAVDLNEWAPHVHGWHYPAGGGGVAVLARLLDCTLLIGFLAMAFRAFRSEASARHAALAAGYAALAMGFVTVTFETGTALDRFLPGFTAGGISVVWGLYAFALLLAGIQRGAAVLRYLGLALFAVVVFKIFASDIQHLGALFKVAAFIILGAVLLMASFVYLKYRGRFVAGHQENGGKPL